MSFEPIRTEAAGNCGEYRRLKLSVDDSGVCRSCRNAPLEYEVVMAAKLLVLDYRSDTPDGGASTAALCKAVDDLVNAGG